MYKTNNTAYAQSMDQAWSPNRVLRNTYLLLSITLAFSALCAYLSLSMGMPAWGALVCAVTSILVLFGIRALAQSSAGIVAVFAFVGLQGASLGPLLERHLALPNGPELVMQALVGTAAVFFSLSAYVLSTKKDFSFMGSFLFAGLIVVLIAAVANIFFAIPAMSLAISAAIVLLMSGLILFDTSNIVNGGETNYIMATVSLYLNIINLFTSILHILGVLSSDD